MIALYPGSFDPPTLGHYNILRKAMETFDAVVVGIGVNPDKQPLFSAEQRQGFFQKWIDRCIAEERDRVGYPDLFRNRVCIEIYNGLTVDCAHDVGAEVMVRGLRDGADLKSEHYISRINNRVGDINTVFMFPDDQYILVSSSFVRQVAELSQDIEKQLSGLVDDEVIAALKRKFA